MSWGACGGVGVGGVEGDDGESLGREREKGKEREMGGRWMGKEKMNGERAKRKSLRHGTGILKPCDAVVHMLSVYTCIGYSRLVATQRIHA